MKISLKLISLSLFFNILLATAACAADQEPSDAPPQLINLNEEEPAVTKSKKESVQKSTQTIQNGEQTEVRVTNEIGTYIVKPNQSVGNSLPGDAQSSSNHAVQWILKKWGGSKNTDPTAAPPVLENNPDDLERQSK